MYKYVIFDVQTIEVLEFQYNVFFFQLLKVLSNNDWMCHVVLQ